jgi:hypothetical protein
MFEFTVKYLGFLKHVPLLPQLFDAFVRIHTFLFRKEVLTYTDEIEHAVLSWKGTKLKMHRYGGIQFDVNGKEIGHIHSNGLLDILFRKEIREQLVREGRAVEHHTFARSGWISVYIRSEADKKNALELLEYSYLLKS